MTTNIIYPSDLSSVNIKNWYITLPSGKIDNPDCIYDLKNYTNQQFFHLNSSKDAIVFIAPAGGVTTSGSNYPRSELREMIDPLAKKEASWSIKSGKHSMISTQAILHLPFVKKSTVIAQIHNSNDDIIEVRLTDKLLEVIHNTKHYGILDSNYILGTKFTLGIVACSGHIDVFYNDLATRKLRIKNTSSGCYFKIGAYTQSNPTYGEKPDAYSEVWVYGVDIKHSL